ncbi:MAG: S-layer homology domain-containing protein [Bryobacterales bacterium]|nr:S-layer homology domain-containing protein [Bryobacterales bacterium]
MQLLALLFLSAMALLAQPVTFSVSGSFRDDKDVIRDSGRLWKIEFIPAQPQQINPSTTRFSYATYGKLRGTPVESAAGPVTSALILELTIRDDATGQTAQISAAIAQTPPNSFLRFDPAYPFSPLRRLGTIGDVHYSFADGALNFSPPANPLDLPARLTRGVTTIDPPAVTVNTVAGRAFSGQVRVNTVDCAPFSGDMILDFSGTSGGQGCGPGSYYFSPYPSAGTVNLLLPFYASGVPRADLRLTLNVQPDPDTLRASPRELNFFYTRGAPEPPDQFITVTGSSDLAFDAAFYDNTWVTITRQGVANTSAGVLRVTPRMTTKPAGRHRTPVQIYTQSRVVDVIYINFFVADGPAVLNSRVQPERAGGIAFAPALNEYRNGDPLQLTAVANPGYVFSHWTGDTQTRQNPIQVTLNGPLNLTAVFTGPAACGYTFYPSRLIAFSFGGSVFTRIAAPSWCETRTAALPNWIIPQFPFSFFGDGTLGVQVVGSGGAGGAHTIRIGTQDLTVEQLSAACSGDVRLAEPPLLDASGTTFFLGANAPAQCIYSADTSQAWLTVPGTMQYFSNSQIPLRAMENPLDQARTASVIAAGRRVVVLQKPVQPVNLFSDVDPQSEAAPYIDLLARNNIDSGCSPGRFCPKRMLTRQEAAMMLVRAMMRGDDFRSPAGAYFQDVPATHPLFRYIQKMRELNLTGGCRTGFFCPNDLLDRGQLAIFLSRARPYTVFSGVQTPSFFMRYRDVPSGLYSSPVQQLADWGIDYGCSATQFCPADKVTREQMAIALVRMFLTP